MYSNCCWAEAGEYEDFGICPSCKEHCEWEEEEFDCGEFLQGQRDCKDGVPQSSEDNDYLRGYAAQYEAEQMATALGIRNEH